MVKNEIVRTPIVFRQYNQSDEDLKQILYKFFTDYLHIIYRFSTDYLQVFLIKVIY